ncbi:uncharacterized protein LOC111134272 [Crassostrea virginica]
MQALLQSLVGSIFLLSLSVAEDEFAVQYYDKTSVYGTYDKEKKCWSEGPDNPELPVSDECQPASVQLKLEYLLKKNPAVQNAIKEKYLHCDKSYYTPVGLDNVCPSTVAFPTKVKVYDTECYIVKPEKQCISYAKCEAKTGCLSSNDYKSTCLMDSFREFETWIYCQTCGFRLITLKLPQCCSCNKYDTC